MKFIKPFIILILIASFHSCGSRKLPRDVVKIYDGQLKLLEGSYLINSYYSPSFSEPLKGIDQFLDFQIPIPIEYVNLKFKDENTLLMTYSLDGIGFKKEFSGKLRRGAFYLSSARGFLGIPPFFYISTNFYVRVMMGNDDNLILERFKKQVVKGINSKDETYDWESFYYDRLYDGIHIDSEGNLIK